MRLTARTPLAPSAGLLCLEATQGSLPPGQCGRKMSSRPAAPPAPCGSPTLKEHLLLSWSRQHPPPARQLPTDRSWPEVQEVSLEDPGRAEKDQGGVWRLFPTHSTHTQAPSPGFIGQPWSADRWDSVPTTSASPCDMSCEPQSPSQGQDPSFRFLPGHGPDCLSFPIMIRTGDKS